MTELESSRPALARGRFLSSHGGSDKTQRHFWIVSLLVLVSAFCWCCSGPQPLSVAIDAQDQDAYIKKLNAAQGNARQAYADWMATERGSTPSQVLQDDATLSETRNPFKSRVDRQAVSRGAVIYEVHCARCHGDDARGKGPSTLPNHLATDFKSFGKRAGATIHNGAPKKWFRVIRDGSGDLVDYPEGRITAMPAFGDELTREQIWLVITYLQSLDVDAARDRKSG